MHERGGSSASESPKLPVNAELQRPEERRDRHAGCSSPCPQRVPGPRDLPEHAYLGYGLGRLLSTYLVDLASPSFDSPAWRASTWKPSGLDKPPVQPPNPFTPASKRFWEPPWSRATWAAAVRVQLPRRAGWGSLCRSRCVGPVCTPQTRICSRRNKKPLESQRRPRAAPTRHGTPEPAPPADARGVGLSRRAVMPCPASTDPYKVRRRSVNTITHRVSSSAASLVRDEASLSRENKTHGGPLPCCPPQASRTRQDPAGG